MIKFIMAHEIRMISLQAVKNERFIRFRNLGLSESPLVCEIHLSRDGTSVETWSLGVQLEVDCFRGLNPDNELVTRNVLEDTLGYILVLYTDFNLGFIQRYDETVSGPEKVNKTGSLYLCRP